MPSLFPPGVLVLSAVPSVNRASYPGGAARAPQAATTEGLYERHSAKILGYCMHQLGSREEAEDAVQTTFMNAFRALGRGVVPEAETAWLFKIAENVCLSRRRSSWRRGRIESPSDFDVIEEIVPGPSRQRDELIGIEDALASMPEQQRRAILLREWQGLSYREIAGELEVSQSAVETLIFRARRSLAQGLEQPDLVKKPKRKSFRRALHVIDLGTVVLAAKALLVGGVAVTAAATAASVTPKVEGHSPRPAAAAPALVASAPTPTPRKPHPLPWCALRTTPRPASPASRPRLPLPTMAVTKPAPSNVAPAAAPAAPTHDPVAAPPAEETPTAAPPPPSRAPRPPPRSLRLRRRPQWRRGRAALPVQAPKPADADGTAKAKKRGDDGRRGNGKARDEQIAPVDEIAPAAVVSPVVDVIEPLDLAAPAPRGAVDPDDAADADPGDAQRAKARPAPQEVAAPRVGRNGPNPGYTRDPRRRSSAGRALHS